MATFDSSSVKALDEKVYFKLNAKRESQLSPTDMVEYFPASDIFIAGMIELAYNEAVLSFEQITSPHSTILFSE